MSRRFPGLSCLLCLVSFGAPAAHADALSTITIMAIDPAASEAGPKAATIFVARNDGDLAKPLSVALQISGTATAGADYVAVASPITFAANVPLVTLKITPIKDTIKEGEETVTLTLVPKAGAYLLGEDKSATATIADAGGGAGAGTPAPTTPPPLPPGVSARNGTLGVTILFDGKGTWKHPKNGAYSNLRFHRELTYTVPLRAIYGAGAGEAEIDRRTAIDTVNVNFKRFLSGHPRDLMAAAGTPCGTGTASILDESTGMEVGDPGQPPLVPFTQTIKGGGKYPSGDRTVPERNLCETYAILDTQRHVLHLRIDGSDTFVKVTNLHNGHAAPPYNLRLQGDAADAKSKFTFFDLPFPANALAAEGSKVIVDASTASGPMNSTFPLTATVRWKLRFE
jgi:Calx-beta domain-containing protein